MTTPQEKFRELFASSYSLVSGIPKETIIEHFEYLRNSLDRHISLAKNVVKLIADEAIAIAKGSHDEDMEQWWLQVKNEIVFFYTKKI